VGAALPSKGNKGVTPNINVTPLVDVVLVLLIIFMLVIPNVQNEGKPIEMITVAAADELADDQEPIVITFDRDENVLVGEEPMATTSDAVQQVVAIASTNPRQRVLLRADARLRYEPVRTLFHELQQGGVVNIALAVGVARNTDELAQEQRG